MIRPSTRKAVWEGLIESDQLQRYYGHHASKLLKRSRYGVWIAAGLAAASAILFAFQVNPWGAVLAALAALVNVVLGISDAGDRVVTAAYRQNRLDALHVNLRTLWERIEAGEPMENREVLDEYRRISLEIATITPADTRGGVDDKLWESCQEQAHAYWAPHATSRKSVPRLGEQPHQLTQ
ncbi:hypothetical protein [Candidatus Palauibacter sp.]|uniref:hypothetical protein n=1 Tax=Candidatus Palauibacter sp. TaxID=3101350 RepID=UPI003AF23BE9